MNRTTQSIANDLAQAWQEEYEHFLREGGMLGDRTRQLVMEALGRKSFQAVFSQCAPVVAQSGPGSAGALQREAERLACQDLCLASPTRVEKGVECFLLAVPCSGTTDEFSRWLEEGSHAEQLKAKVRAHLALLLDIPLTDVRKLEALPFLLPPPAVASMTPDARRALLHELLNTSDPVPGPALRFAAQHQRLSQSGALLNAVVLGEGLWLMAASLRTDWENEDSPSAQRLSDLSSGTLDEDLLAQAEDRWGEAIADLDMPELAFIPQPLSINDGLMRTLQAHLMSSRLAAYSADHLRERLRANELQVPAIVHLECFQNAQGWIVIKAQSEEGLLPQLQVSPHWAFTEGERAWEAALTEAFQLEGAPFEARETAAPAEEEGDHPAWKIAQPVSKRIH